jgi:hypothetical protein
MSPYPPDLTPEPAPTAPGSGQEAPNTPEVALGDTPPIPIRSTLENGCCGACGGTGHNGDPDTWGWCPDCRGTGHDHAIDTLADRIACVLAVSADRHGIHDYDGQAADVLACLQRLGLLMPDAYLAEHAEATS